MKRVKEVLMFFPMLALAIGAYIFMSLLPAAILIGAVTLLLLIGSHPIWAIVIAIASVVIYHGIIEKK